MKGMKIVVILLLLFALQPSFIDAQEWGEGVSLIEDTVIEEIFLDPDSYDGQRVKILGRVDEQDEHGYWFFLIDEFARIYVDLSENHLSVPSLSGLMVSVEGNIKVEFGVPSMYAIGIECISMPD